MGIIIKSVPAQWNAIHLPKLMQRLFDEDGKDMFFGLFKLHDFACQVDMNYLKNIFHQLIAKLSSKRIISDKIDYIDNIVKFKPTITTERYLNGNSAILLASKGKNLELVQYLLSKGNNKEDFNLDHENCFYLSLKYKNPNIFKLLFKDEPNNPLHLALSLYSNDLVLIEKIIKLIPITKFFEFA